MLVCISFCLNEEEKKKKRETDLQRIENEERSGHDPSLTFSWVNGYYVDSTVIFLVLAGTSVFDIAHSRTAHTGLLQKSLEEDLC